MTAIDANVLIAFLRADHSVNGIAAAALGEAAQKGPLCICGAIFTELLGFPGRTSEELLRLLKTLGIQVEWRLEEADWTSAGLAFQGYVGRRRASGGGLPRRIATDFLIGAHASVRGYSLLTFDQGLYAAAFPSLSITSL